MAVLHAPAVGALHGALGVEGGADAVWGGGREGRKEREGGGTNEKEGQTDRRMELVRESGREVGWEKGSRLLKC